MDMEMTIKNYWHNDMIVPVDEWWKRTFYMDRYSFQRLLYDAHENVHDIFCDHFLHVQQREQAGSCRVNKIILPDNSPDVK